MKKEGGRGGGEEGEEGGAAERPTLLKTSQHDMIERYNASPHREPRGASNLPDNMVLVRLLMRWGNHVSSSVISIYLRRGLGPPCCLRAALPPGTWPLRTGEYNQHV